MRPGSTVLPATSYTRAPSGMPTDVDGPTARMSRPRSTTIASGSGGPELPSITVLPTSATSCAIRRSQNRGDVQSRLWAGGQPACQCVEGIRPAEEVRDQFRRWFCSAGCEHQVAISPRLCHVEQADLEFAEQIPGDRLRPQIRVI